MKKIMSLHNSTKVDGKVSAKRQILHCNICELNVKTTINFYNHLIKDHSKLELSLCILDSLNLLAPKGGERKNDNSSTQTLVGSSNVKDIPLTNENCTQSDSDIKQQKKKILSHSDETANLANNSCSGVTLLSAQKSDFTPNQLNKSQESSVRHANPSSVQETIEYVVKYFEMEESNCTSTDLNSVPLPPLPDNIEKNCASPLKNQHISGKIKDLNSPQKKKTQIFQRKEQYESQQLDLCKKSVPVPEPVNEIFEGKADNVIDLCEAELEETINNLKNNSETLTGSESSIVNEEEKLFFSQLGLVKYDTNTTIKVPPIAGSVTETEYMKKHLYNPRDGFNFRIPIKFFMENPMPEDDTIFEPLLSPTLEIVPKIEPCETMDAVLECGSEKLSNSRSVSSSSDNHSEGVTSDKKNLSRNSTLKLPEVNASGIQSVLLSVLPETTVNQPNENISKSSASNSPNQLKSSSKTHYTGISDDSVNTATKAKVDEMDKKNIKCNSNNIGVLSHSSVPSENISESSKSNKFDANDFVNLVSKLASPSSSKHMQLDKTKREKAILPVSKSDGSVESSQNVKMIQISRNCETSKISLTRFFKDNCATVSGSNNQSHDSQRSEDELNHSKSDIPSNQGDIVKVLPSKTNGEPDKLETQEMIRMPYILSANGMFWQVFESQNSSNPIKVLKPIEVYGAKVLDNLVPEKVATPNNSQPPVFSKTNEGNAPHEIYKKKKRKRVAVDNVVELKSIRIDGDTVVVLDETKSVTSQTENLKLPRMKPPKIVLLKPTSKNKILNCSASNFTKPEFPLEICSEYNINSGSCKSVDSSSLNDSGDLNLKTESQVSQEDETKLEEHTNKDELSCYSLVSAKPRFHCHFCDKNYSKKNHLIRHVRMHMNERPYECDVCHKGFTTSSILKQHVRLHSGERPYICSVCSKSFSQKSSLLTHSMLHTGKPFKCFFCRADFVSNHKLQRHLTRHDVDDSDLHCCVCDYNFTVEGAFRQHLALVHDYTVRDYSTNESGGAGTQAKSVLKRRRKVRKYSVVPKK